MALAKWQIIDEQFAHCEQCGAVCLHAELLARKCNGCREADKDRRRTALAKVETRLAKTAVKELLETIRSHGREGAILPQVIESMVHRIGGRERLGEIVADEFLKARGEGLSELEAATWERQPKIIAQFAELCLRYISKADEGKQLDVSGMSEEDLQAVLTGLLHDMIANNADFRKLAIAEAISADPSLVHVAMECAGMGAPIECQPHTPLPPIDDQDDGQEAFRE